MSGPTLLQALVLGGEGRLLFESFEGLNWGSDQGWTTLQGSPQASSDTAQDGLKSLKMDSTYPQIEKVISAGFELLVGWFFDDHTETASAFAPFLQARKTGSTNWGLGVDNGTSTGFYTKEAAGAKTATTVARSTGWHRFSFERIGSDYILKIDGTDVGVAAGTGTASFDRVRVGSTNAAGTAFGYFDFIQIGTSPLVTVRGLQSGQKVSLYDSTGAQIGSTATSTGASVTINVAAEDQPMAKAFVRITRTDGANPRFRSGGQEMFGGDTWTLVEVQVERKVGMLDPRRDTRREDTESNSGKHQSIFFNARDRVIITMNEITEDQRHQFLQWWAWAQRGFVYSVAIDAEDVYNGELQAAVAPGATVVSVDAAAGAAAGSWMQLRRTDNLHGEEVLIASISGTNITLASPLIYAYRVNDTLRSLRYWPFVRSLDKAQNISLANLKQKRWNFAHSFKEDL